MSVIRATLRRSQGANQHLAVEVELPLWWLVIVAQPPDDDPEEDRHLVGRPGASTRSERLPAVGRLRRRSTSNQAYWGCVSVQSSTRRPSTLPKCRALQVATAKAWAIASGDGDVHVLDEDAARFKSRLLFSEDIARRLRPLHQRPPAPVLGAQQLRPPPAGAESGDTELDLRGNRGRQEHDGPFCIDTWPSFVP